MQGEESMYEAFGGHDRIQGGDKKTQAFFELELSEPHIFSYEQTDLTKMSAVLPAKTLMIGLGKWRKTISKKEGECKWVVEGTLVQMVWIG